jgi:hypothetical protein
MVWPQLVAKTDGRRTEGARHRSYVRLIVPPSPGQSRSARPRRARSGGRPGSGRSGQVPHHPGDGVPLGVDTAGRLLGREAVHNPVRDPADAAKGIE